MPNHSSSTTRTTIDINTGLLRQRRNLVASSTAIIIYVLAGGSITSTSLIFGSIDIQYPVIIELSIWIFFFYSLWRYELYSGSEKENFQHSLADEFSRDKKFARFVEKIINDDPILKKIENKNPVLESRLFKRELDFSKSIEIKDRLSNGKRNILQQRYRPDKNQKANPEETYKVNVKYLDIWPIQVHCILKTCAKDQVFSDYYLPYILSLFAILTGAIKYFL